MNIRKHIPNTITCLHLTAGCISIVMAFEGLFLWALIWIIIAGVLDFCDGLAARLLHAYSDIGKDMDSLADVVSFGAAPGMILFCLLREAAVDLPWESIREYIPYTAFVVPAFSCLRLAKFNNDTRQSTSFIGLPVPAHALLWASAAYAILPVVHHYTIYWIPAVICLFTLTSLLLVSEIPMFSFKIKSLAWKGNELRYMLVACALLFVLFFGFLGITGTIILYILLSIFNSKRS